MSSRRPPLRSIEDPGTANAGLWFDKMLKSQVRREGNNANQTSQEEAKKSRSDLIKRVAGIKQPEGYEAFFNLWKTSLDSIGARYREAEVIGRMLIGTGNESVLETAMTLHHTYGVPCIPGSALKGLAASFAHQHLGENWKRGSHAYSTIFGSTDESGYINFFDALYVPNSGKKQSALHADVLTVHHENYYQNKNDAPADWDDPNPVPLLSATGRYLIALAASQACDTWLEVTFKILEHALKEMGVGAKTSSGYGRVIIYPAP